MIETILRPAAAPVRTGRFACPMMSDSLAPRVQPGEYLVIDREARPEPGDMVVIRFKDGRGSAFILDRIEGDAIALHHLKPLRYYQLKMDDVAEFYRVSGIYAAEATDDDE